tara:strand:+ start:1365 stop:1535 length:171 start_codon:yes stop_codon:yes gene_type:complete
MDKLKFSDMLSLLTQNSTEDEKQWIVNNMSGEEIIDLFFKITKERIRKNEKNQYKR